MKIRKILLLVVFIILSMPLSGYAAEYTIYVWGNADVTANMLHAVSRMMRGEDFNNLFKITALISIVVIVLSLMSDKNFSPFLVGQKIILVILVQVLLATSVDRVKIVDKLGNINNNFVEATIDNVPTVVAFPLYFFSQIDQSLRIMFRDALNSTPGAVQAFNTANGMPVTTALSLVQSASTFKITDINFMKTFDSYMENCIRPDVITGYIDLHAIGNSNDIWQALSRTKHGSRIANDYINAPVGNNNSSIDGIIRSCTDVYDVITNALNNIGANHLDQLKNSLGLSAQTNMEQILGSSASMTFNYQQNGSSLLKQSMMVNAFNDSYMTVAQATGVDASALGYGMAKAQEVSRLNSTMSGIMAKKYLPLAKSYLTIIFIVIIPLIFLIALATGTIKKPIGMIVMMLMAISLWGVGEQILDYIILVRTHSLFPNGLQAINLITQPAVDQAILDSLSLSYGMYWMIPTLAIAIASMSGYAAANMMGGISGRVSSGVGSAASEAATGSASYGIVRADMINTNKYDTTQTMSVGQSLSSVNDSKNSTMNKSNVGYNQNIDATDKEILENNREINGQNWGAGSTVTQLGNGMTKVEGYNVDRNGYGQAIFDKNGNLVREDYKGGSQAAYDQLQTQIANNGIVYLDDGRVIEASDLEITKKGNRSGAMYNIAGTDKETGERFEILSTGGKVHPTDKNGYTKVETGRISEYNTNFGENNNLGNKNISNAVAGNFEDLVNTANGDMNKLNHFLAEVAKETNNQYGSLNNNISRDTETINATISSDGASATAGVDAKAGGALSVITGNINFGASVSENISKQSSHSSKTSFNEQYNTNAIMDKYRDAINGLENQEDIIKALNNAQNEIIRKLDTTNKIVTNR